MTMIRPFRLERLRGPQWPGAWGEEAFAYRAWGLAVVALGAEDLPCPPDQRGWPGSKWYCVALPFQPHAPSR
jgi:hypothetical protein